MEKYAVFVPRLVPEDEHFVPGHRACIGCAEALAVRLTLKALGRNTIVANATGCMEIVSSCLPQTTWNVPWIHTLFENTAAVIAGVETARKVLAKKGKIPPDRTYYVAIAGDGGTSDIGFQALSGALERGHDIVYFCYDNEAYMNTGIQRSSATPYGASTTTAPAGKASIGQTTWKKDLPEIAVAHKIPYVATACPSYPFDLMEKVRKAARIEGPAYLHILSPCPTGWRCPPELAITIGRLAVESGVFPLYEVENGKYTLNIDFPSLRPAKQYLKLQGRFRHLPDGEIEKIQRGVEERWRQLKARLNR